MVMEGRIARGIQKLRSDGTFINLDTVTASLIYMHPILYPLNMGSLLHADYYLIHLTTTTKKTRRVYKSLLFKMVERLSH